MACCTEGLAQNIKVVKKTKIYRQQVAADPHHELVSLPKIIPHVQSDLRYATPGNFTGKALYPPSAQPWLRSAPAAALKEVQLKLQQHGYGVKIFDAYRPYAATVMMWNLVRDERYVANPAKGSGHNRGLAVDLTLFSLQTGKELDMGTGFDHFTDTAHHNFKHLPEQVLQNRVLLRKTMEAAGFRALETEWWHYSWPNDRNYSVLDIPFKKL